MGPDFEELQRDKLVEAWRADLPGSTTRHVLIGLPSYSVDRALYDHYGDRVPALETRYVYALLRACEPATRVVYLSSLPLHADVLDGYLRLLDPVEREAALASSLVVTPADTSRRALAEKVLDRGDLIDQLRGYIGNEPAIIEAWNVTEAEAALAVALGAPINGTSPALRPLATKSNGRRLLRDAGVPVPDGVEDVSSIADVVAAMVWLWGSPPRLCDVVVKLDDSVAGDGNVLVPASVLGDEQRGLAAPEVLTSRLAGLLPAWFVDGLTAGGVVEKRIEGQSFRSPSMQGSISPTGEVSVLATHEQRLGGPDQQVYEGCEFPADPAYAADLATYGLAAGQALAAQGACGRYSVDFVAHRHASGAWQLYALEINLRKGGTTHPLGLLRVLTGGAYDASAAAFHDGVGERRCYVATDNLIDEAWIGRPPADALEAVAGAGLLFDRNRRTGVVPHLLDCLRVDGRMGYTAIGTTLDHARQLEQEAVAALQ